MEREVRQIVVASPEQVAEINHLLGIVKLPEGSIEKWLTAAQVETWEEMEADKADKVIQVLRAKLQG